MSACRLRICIVYDRVYPASIGGAERWYGLLAERLAADGHEVTYLTTRHWQPSEAPDIPGVQIVAPVSAGPLYGASQRRIAPVLRFTLTTWVHLLRHGGQYDVVHGSAMASLAGLGTATISYFKGYRVVLDWWEVWPLTYWQQYAGSVSGTLGWILQWRLAQARHTHIAHSALHANRLRRLAPRRLSPDIQRGLLPMSSVMATPLPASPRVVYVGRQIAEKQVDAIVPAVAKARIRLPELEATLFGDGPAAPAVRAAIQTANLEQIVETPGFASEQAVVRTLKRALCLILLSRREGFGLVVAEAAARGVPSVVLRHPDSAASELIVDGVNGVICDSADPETVASAILRVNDAGYDLRLSTLAWSRANANTLTIDGTLPRLEAIYRSETTDP